MISAEPVIYILIFIAVLALVQGAYLVIFGKSISMDGKGRWVDNVFVERLWRSLKYEEVYLNAYDSPTEARQSLKKYFRFYNQGRKHQTLKVAPDQVYYESIALSKAA